MFKRFSFSLLTLTLLSPFAQAEIQAGAEIAVVQSTQGKIQGYIQDGIVTYKGIPYATAERFMPPQKVAKWDDTRLALKYGNICPQLSQNPMNTPLFSGGSFTQSEDCQNLNIWTPALDNKKRAVMVWIHGGGFQAGSSMESDTYHGENLARSQDVVVVSVNHRLNAMGFLDLSAYGEAYQQSGNVGMLDLVAALQWVKENIAQFGGDPNKVTIFGESGGGAKSLVLMAMPSAQGLFHKAIVQSGAVERSGMTLTTSEESRLVAKHTLKNLGLSEKEVDKLRTLPYNELEAASRKALQQTADELKIPAVLGKNYGMLWTPVMDSKIVPSQPVGEAYPSIAQHIPLLIGSNLTEWMSFPLQLDLAKTQRDNRNTWTEAEKQQKLTARFGAKTAEIIDAFKQAYPNRNIADALYVDTFLRVPALKTARLKAAQPAPVYNYLFTWDTPLFGGVPMSYHTAEIPFVMNAIDKAQHTTGGGEQAKKLAQTKSTAWANFAKTGNPNGGDLPQWDAYTPQNGATMIFDNDVKQVHHHDDKLLKLLAPNGKF
ncbi:hypothetical protein MHD_00760 [Mannheimia granulomatis]|nr:carboxylesterase family protein [Mannheimia granulomatis]RGE49367.1 hypothetical protein MHD_00760 [Mannheimia granulomatis]